MGKEGARCLVRNGDIRCWMARHPAGSNPCDTNPGSFSLPTLGQAQSQVHAAAVKAQSASLSLQLSSLEQQQSTRAATAARVSTAASGREIRLPDGPTNGQGTASFHAGSRLYRGLRRGGSQRGRSRCGKASRRSGRRQEGACGPGWRRLTPDLRGGILHGCKILKN